MPRTYVRRPGQRMPLPPESRAYRIPVPRFYDKFFFVQGSVPEKMVMAELVRRGIYFEHTPQTNPINWGMLASIASSDPTKWEADFLFPQYKIWLEVQGAYFHSKPGVPEKEALRFALIEAAGWKPIYWWDYDIEARLIELMDSVPEFYRPNDPLHWKDRDHGSHHLQPRRAYGPHRLGGNQRGLPFYEGGWGIDHLAGLRKANANRATTPQYTSKYRKTGTRRPK